MKRVLVHLILTVAVMAVLSACADPVRYSKMVPGADDFRPGAIGVLAIDVGPHDDTREIIDQIVTEALIRSGSFTKVLSREETGKLAGSDESKAVLNEYLSKLGVVNFSDPDLSRRLGEICGVDTFLLVSLSFWSYTVNTKDRDIAKVGLEMRLLEASTGRILWTGHHFEERRYRLFKPELADVGSSVARRLVQEMPR